MTIGARFARPLGPRNNDQAICMNNTITGYSTLLGLALGLVTASAAAEPAARPAQCPALGAASVKEFTVTCADGLVPTVMSGNLTGHTSTPDAKLAFSGKYVALAYCAGTEAAVDGCDTPSSVTGAHGERLACPAGELPFALEGSAEGVLSTSRGQRDLAWRSQPCCRVHESVRSAIRHVPTRCPSAAHRMPWRVRRVPGARRKK
jgi:hypothetical protein